MGHIKAPSQAANDQVLTAPIKLERFAQLVNSRRRELESLGNEDRQREASNLLEAMRKLFFALGGG